MSLAIYVHIPYCIQRCHYCDFTTFEASSIMPPEKYIELLVKEIRMRSQKLASKNVTSIYFGGGTPSLVPPKLIVSVIDELANAGFHLSSDCEITIEINPATLDRDKLNTLISGGFNRFSVGAQTFNQKLLKRCGREHSVEDTHRTLELIGKHNYSFDLLFGLPHQSMDNLLEDLRIIEQYDPPHISTYCLTVPSGHPMSRDRPKDSVQLSMFQAIKDKLESIDTLQYEISNFSKLGFRSKHNSSYWDDSDFWGIGLSAHSYLGSVGNWGVRFWNPKSFDLYADQLKNQAELPFESLGDSQVEFLLDHESLTDFCHTRLRTTDGLRIGSLENKFPHISKKVYRPRFETLASKGLVQTTSDGAISLTEEGLHLSNQVFLELTFTNKEITI